MIKGIQFLGIIVGLYLLLKTVSSFRKGYISTSKTLILVSLWIGMILLFYETTLMRYILPVLATEDAVLSVLVLGVLVNFILFIQLLQESNKLEHKFTRLVQNIAINEYVQDMKHKDDEK